MKKIWAVLLSAVILLTEASCGKANGKAPENGASSAAGACRVTDSRGKAISFEKAPEKIISLLPSDTEILYALGEGGKLIAVDKNSDYPPEALKKQQLESGEKTNIEAIVGLKPDLVLMGEMAQSKSQVEQLEGAGVKVLVTRADNIADTYRVIGMIGKSVNREAKADDIVRGMKKDFAEIEREVKGKPAKTVYIEISPLKYKLWSCGKGTFQDELLTLAGGKNIFSDIDGWKEVSEEQVLSRNPDIIITTSGIPDGIPNPAGEIKSRKNWDKIGAVRNGKVFAADSDALQRPGPRLAAAAKSLEKMIYG